MRLKPSTRYKLTHKEFTASLFIHHDNYLAVTILNNKKGIMMSNSGNNLQIFSADGYNKFVIDQQVVVENTMNVFIQERLSVDSKG